MRMWMIDPKLMCIQHIVGEHRELHALKGSLERTKPECNNYERHIKNIITLAKEGFIDLKSLKSRHEELVKHIENHNSPMENVPTLKHLPKEARNAKVDKEKAVKDIIDRPEACRPVGCCGDKIKDET